MRNRGRIGRVGLETHASEGHPGEPAEPRRAGGEGEGVAEQHPLHADQTQSHDAHHHRVERVLGPHQAAVEERQAHRHQQDQRARDEHPGGIAGGNHGGHRAPSRASLSAACCTSSALTAVRAATSRSPERMRITCSIGWTKILPSPTSPVRAAERIAWMHGSTNGSEQTISIFTFSWNSIRTVVPRYSLSTSRSPPCPLTRLSVMPVIPARNSAALTSASRSGRTMVVMSFMSGNIGKRRAACQEKRAQIAQYGVQQRRLYAQATPAARRIVHRL